MNFFYISIFITFYRFSLFLNRIKHHAAFSDNKHGAVLYLSSFEAFNLLVLFWFLNMRQPFGLPIMVVPYLFIFYILNWFFLIKKENAIKLVDEYNQYSLKQKKLSGIISITYLIVSISAPIVYNECFK